MKKKFLILSFLAVTAFVFGQEIKENQLLPKFTVKTENGILKSSNLKGKIVLINFFATWCGPCMKELPHLQKEIWEKYKDNKKFSLLVIGREHSQSEITEFKAKKGFTLPIYPDEDRSVYSLFAKEYIPRNYIIDKKGNVVYTSISFDEIEFKKMVDKLDELLK
ncbi:TlpA family protein disulfide reductase [Chryseobacterium ginsenosidimutans]|uniref:TlpA family protein disulfide reductase n=1 Tax=Chryseobacterium ginsenosidimutans TaxID=687846 RepID=UPI0027B8FA7F|nr:TlpA disulfide reductase family protein [Chryseobacterium ginsenosidimutans]